MSVKLLTQLVAKADIVMKRVPDSRHMYFCSEAVAASIGFDEPWRLDPNTFATIIRQRAVEHG